ncbi:Predicted kinase [Streptomyces aidingensis]|uniref:Predicted kinase n=1 Tax=Streptomyces aidingensis TaxID=910347 RepID=A0A1I1SH79_9ACTN|nr:AAA family ATPase [Streptomyces aidingensis]SFD45682.1 Predicted kinase [Streptomyces aidingensis]
MTPPGTGPTPTERYPELVTRMTVSGIRTGPDMQDLRGAPPDAERVLCWPAGHRVIVSGLPGSGKSTLMSRIAAAPGGRVLRLDSQDTRERWARRLPAWLPYACYRPGVRLAHYARVRRALRGSCAVVVHDCGRSPWVRRWLARDSRRRGLGLHLVVLDVDPAEALAGQSARGRRVSRAAFRGHRRAMARLLAELEAGRMPSGCTSVTLLDGPSARTVTGLFRTVGAPRAG